MSHGYSAMLTSLSLALLSMATSENPANSLSKKYLRISLCQFIVTPDKSYNIRKAKEFICKGKENGADLVILPECWNSPYSTSKFHEYAEIIDGNSISEDACPSVFMLSNISKEKGLWIIGGSVPEREGNKLYNTCVIFNPNGQIVGKHRKIHLFDIDVPGRIKFKESDALSAGNSPTIFETPWGKIGVGICYDLRFPELALLMRSLDCFLLVYPGAFNMVTGNISCLLSCYVEVP